MNESARRLEVVERGAKPRVGLLPLLRLRFLMGAGLILLIGAACFVFANHRMANGNADVPASISAAGSNTGRTITIFLLNGVTGKPMTATNVTFMWADSFDQTIVAVDKNGRGSFEVPDGKRQFLMIPGPKPGKEPYRVPFVDCNSRTGQLGYSVEDAIQKGIVPGNECSQRTADQQPGVVIFWGQPIPWWMPDMQ
jgi:hypothetical protein